MATTVNLMMMHLMVDDGASMFASLRVFAEVRRGTYL